jgi:hypothetical protein
MADQMQAQDGDGDEEFWYRGKVTRRRLIWWGADRLSHRCGNKIRERVILARFMTRVQPVGNDAD